MRVALLETAKSTVADDLVPLVSSEQDLQHVLMIGFLLRATKKE